MKLWIVNHYAIAPDDAGGTRHFSFAQKLSEKGHDVTIIASSANYLSKKDERLAPGEKMQLQFYGNVKFLWVKTPGYSTNLGRVWSMIWFAITFLISVPKFLKTKPDCILGSSPHLFSALAALFAARKYKARFVFEVRDLWPQSFIDLNILAKHHPLVILLGLIERVLCKNSDAVITLLPNSFEYLISKGAKKETIFWIPNGVDLSLLPPETPVKPGPIKTLMYVGAHGIPNDLDFIIDTITEVNRRGLQDKFRFRFIGDGPVKDALIMQAKKAGLVNVSFEPPVAKHLVYKQLSEADAFVLAIRESPLYKWGFSLNKIFDFLAMGRPIALFSSADYDPISDANAGLTVKSREISSAANALINMIELSDQERTRLGENGKKYINERHSIEELSKKMESILNI